MHPCVSCQGAGKLQALVYDILPPTIALSDYAIGHETLSANGKFFAGAEMAVICNRKLKSYHAFLL